MKSIFNYLLYFLLCFSLLNLHIDHSAKVRFSSVTASECVDEEGRCDITTQETNAGGLILTERIISMVTLIGVGVATVFIVRDCLSYNKGKCAQVGIIAAGAGAVLLLAGEIAAIIMYKDIEKKLEFREASVKEHDQDCDPDNDESGEGIGEIRDDEGEVTNVCGQLSAINNQLTALKGSRTAAITSLALKSAALVAFGVATVAEIMAELGLKLALNIFKKSFENLKSAQEGAYKRATNLHESYTAKIDAGNPTTTMENQSENAGLLLAACKAFLDPLQSKLVKAELKLDSIEPEEVPKVKAEAITRIITDSVFITPLNDSCGNEILSAYPMFSNSFKLYKNSFKALRELIDKLIDGRSLEANIESETEAGETGAGETGAGETGAGETGAGETGAGETGAGGTEAGGTEAGGTEAGGTENSDPSTPLGSILGTNIIHLVQNFLFSKAFAIEEKGKKGVFSLVAFVGLAAAILITARAIKGSAKQMITTPKTRAITYSVFAGFAGVAVGINAAIIVELDKQIASLEDVLSDSLTEDLNGPNASSGGGQSGSSSSSAVDYGFDDSESDEIDLNPDDQPMVCPFGGDGKGGCKGESKMIKQELASLGFSTGSGSTASLLAKVSDALSDGSISSGDMDDVASLADKQAVIEKKLKKVLKKYNKLQKQTGGKKFKLDKLTGIAAAKLKSKIVKALRSNPKAMKGLQSGISNNLLASNSNKKDKKSVLPSKRAVVGNTTSSDNSGFNFQFDNEEESNSDFDLLDEEEYSEGVNIPASGISNNEKGSIFSLITSRYMKSAYPVFFEEGD
jgi:hypothetical protein